MAGRDRPTGVQHLRHAAGRRRLVGEGIKPLTPHVGIVRAIAAPVPPSGSTLPRLAEEVPHTLALIAPYNGVEGITHQLEELIEHLDPESIDVLDVGGDILGHGDEPTLRSPLADALTFAAYARVLAPFRPLVAGPGLDAELPLKRWPTASEALGINGHQREELRQLPICAVTGPGGVAGCRGPAVPGRRTGAVTYAAARADRTLPRWAEGEQLLPRSG